MLGAEGQPAENGGRLLRIVQAQGLLLKAINGATEIALEAVSSSDLEKLEDVLVQRERLMVQVENIQLQERELRSGGENSLIADLEPELEEAQEQIRQRLEQTIKLNKKLEESLHKLRGQLDKERHQLGKLRRTAEGYRPKEVGAKALFLDQNS